MTLWRLLLVSQRSPLGGRGLVHSDSTVQMQFHMADKMEENPRIWQVGVL